MEIASTPESALAAYPYMDTPETEMKGARLGEVIIARRTALGLNQTQLAERVGVKPRDMWRYEKKGVVPDPQRLQRIAKALEMSLDDLFIEANIREIAAPDGQTAILLRGVQTYGFEDDETADMRRRALLNLLKDDDLKVERHEIELLEQMVEGIAAFRGLDDMQKLLRLMLLGYRQDPAGYAVAKPLSEAGQSMTDAARESGAKKGHATLGKASGKR